MEKERGPALGGRLALLTGPHHSAELLFGFFSASSPITTESRSFHLDMFGELAQSLAQGRPHLGPAAASAHLGGGGGSPRGGPEPRQAASEAGRQGSTGLQLSAWNSLSWIPLTRKGTARFGVNCARND